MNKKHAQVAVAAMAALGGSVGFVHDLHAAVVIQEVYGGGGSASTTAVPTYNQDFIELYNNGVAAADITGDIVAYNSSKSTNFFSTQTGLTVTIPTFTLAPGQYYLIAGAFSSSFTGAALPVAADLTSGLSLAAAAGEVGLLAPGTAVGTAVALSALDGTVNTVVLDGIGYGSVGQYETTSTAALTVTTAAFRTVTGFDTNVNNVDFTVGAVVAPMDSGIAATPEPASLGLAAVASALMLRRRK